MATRERPLSPFMLGSYYRPQLTSVLSFIHRATGVALAVGAFGVGFWLHRVAGDEGRYETFRTVLESLPGRLVLCAFAFALLYHLLNGIRHLGWDAGRGLDLASTYRSGWTVVVLSVLATAGVAALALRGGA